MATKEINCTPNFKVLFASFCREAEQRGDRLAGDLLAAATAEYPASTADWARHIATLRVVQALLVPLNVAIQSATDTEDIVEFRALLHAIAGNLDVRATALELEQAQGPDENDCDCSDRSWYGAYHDSECPLAGRTRAAWPD